MDSNKKSYLLLIAILLMGFIVSAGTFAYFQWTTDDTEKTNVNVTIKAGGIKMTIAPQGGKLETTGLRPVADCTKSYAYVDTDITITNTTGTLVVPSFKLKARVKPNGDGLRKVDLSHIHYSVVRINSIGDTSAPLCNQPSDITGSETGLFSSTSNDGVLATGTFEDMEAELTEGWTSAINLPSDTGVYLPRQYNSAGLQTAGITFIGNVAGASGSTDTKGYFRVYVWIDEGYTATIVGNTISDPLQKATIEVTWSEASIVQQVTGEASGTGAQGGETVLAAGLYNSSGTLVSTWDELETNGDVEFSDGENFEITAIANFNSNLTGRLIIPDGVTGIGDFSFQGSKLTSIVMPDSLRWIGVQSFDGSNLTGQLILPNQVYQVYEGAFANTSITSVVIPKTLTSILMYAFDGVTLTNVHYEGTEAEWNAIGIEEGNESLINATRNYNYSYE